MKAHDLGSSLFWLLLSVYVCIESLRGGIGTLREPGMGFIGFGASVLLGILSLTLFLKTLLQKKRLKMEPVFVGKLWRRVLFVLIVLILYANFIDVGGYLISTFLLMSFLFLIVRAYQWWWVLVISALVTISAHLFFSGWLKVEFPKGFLGI